MTLVDLLQFRISPAEQCGGQCQHGRADENAGLDADEFRRRADGYDSERRQRERHHVDRHHAATQVRPDGQLHDAHVERAHDRAEQSREETQEHGPERRGRQCESCERHCPEVGGGEHHPALPADVAEPGKRQGTRQRADAHGRENEAEILGTASDRVGVKGGQQHLGRESERHGADAHDEESHHDAFPFHVSESVPYVGQYAGAALSSGIAPVAHHGRGDDGRGEESADDVVDDADAGRGRGVSRRERCDQCAGQRRSKYAREVERGTLQRHGVDHVAAAYDVRNDRRPRRHAERHHRAVEQAEPDEVPECHVPLVDEGRQHEHGGRTQDLGGDDDPFLAHAVGDHAADQGEQHRREHGRQHDPGQGQRRSRHVVDEPAAGNHLHLHGKRSREVGEPDVPEVREKEGGEHPSRIEGRSARTVLGFSHAGMAAGGRRLRGSDGCLFYVAGSDVQVVPQATAFRTRVSNASFSQLPRNRRGVFRLSSTDSSTKGCELDRGEWQ